MKPALASDRAPSASAQRRMDLPNIALGAQAKLADSENGHTGGTLTVNDGRHAVATWQLHGRKLGHHG